MDLFKRVNSKGFLLLYLVVFACLLAMLLFQRSQTEKDERIIPEPFARFIVSPPRQIPQFLLHSAEGKVLTEQALRGKWSFVYFSQPRCRPDCEPVYSVLNHLRQLSASNQQQVLVINFDDEQAQERILAAQDLAVYSGDKAMLDSLADAFAFLFLRTDFTDHYQLEQQHSIFLVDPKGRVYARFEPPFTSLHIQKRFFSLREFYARTE